MFKLTKILKLRLLLAPASAALLFINLLSCDSNGKKEAVPEDEKQDGEMSFSVEAAPEWTEVFKRESGWFGGDGIFAIPYSAEDNGTEGDSILFLFSDTMIGEIVDGELQPGYSMVNNSVAMYEKGQDPSSTTFFLAEDADGKETSFVAPDTDNEDYYWLGDGFVNKHNNKLYIFSYRIRNLEEESDFPFMEVGNDLLVINNKNELPLQVDRKLEIPHFQGAGENDNISFGAGLYTEGEEVYVYGVRGPNKQLLVARTTLENIEDFSSWEFRGAEQWSTQRQVLHPLAEQVSNELSVSKLVNGQYVLIYQQGGIYPKILMQLADTPYGPFGEPKEVWDTTTEVDHPDLFTYNAKAHPAISEEGELLVSYNVNSFKFFDVIESMPQLYRPRFIKIKFDFSE